MRLDALLASPLVQLNLVGFAGIVVWHLIPRRRVTTRLVVQIAFFEGRPREARLVQASPPRA
jgi:hypothetical protein